MDVYAAQKMFGRGRTFDRIDVGLAPGPDDCRDAGGAQQRCSGRVPGRSALGARPAVRGDDRGLLDDGEHLEPVRAVHRDVHHLQRVRDCRDAAPIGDRRAARARRDPPADPIAVSRRERGHRRHRLDWRRGVRPADCAGDCRVDRRISSATCTASRSTSKRRPPIRVLLGARGRHRRRHEHHRRR